MSGHGAAVLSSALDSRAPALGLAVAGRQSRDDGAGLVHGLGVVARGRVVLVVEGDGRAGIGGAAGRLDGLLGVVAGRHQGVGVHAPVARVVVLGDGLDQIAVGGAHAHPQGEVTAVVARGVREGQGCPRLDNVGVGRSGTGRESRAVGGLDLIDDGSSGRQGGENVA